MQNLGEQRQRDHSTNRKEGYPRRLEQSPERIAYDSRGEVRAARVISCLENRLRRPREKRVRIAFRQQLPRALTDLGTYEHELGMQLPGLDVIACGQRQLVDEPRFSAGPRCYRLPRDGAKPVFEA